MDELELTAAAFFRNKGKNVVTENEFCMGISMGLRWMTPTDAQELIGLMVVGGVLERDGEYLRPAFDVNSVDVPLGFRPSADVLGTKRNKAVPPPAGGLLSKLMAESELMGIKKKDLIVSVNAIQKRMNIDIEIAALMFLREGGADVSGYFAEAYRTIAER